MGQTPVWEQWDKPNSFVAPRWKPVQEISPSTSEPATTTPSDPWARISNTISKMTSSVQSLPGRKSATSTGVDVSGSYTPNELMLHKNPDPVIPTTSGMGINPSTNPYLSQRQTLLQMAATQAEGRRAAAMQQAQEQAARAGYSTGTDINQRMMLEAAAQANQDARVTQNTAAVEGLALQEKDYLHRENQATQAMNDLLNRSQGLEGERILSRIRAANPQADNIALAQLFDQAVADNPEAFRSLTAGEKADLDAIYEAERFISLHGADDVIRQLRESGEGIVNQMELGLAIQEYQNSGDTRRLAQLYGLTNRAITEQSQMTAQENAILENAAMKKFNEVTRNPAQINALTPQDMNIISRDENSYTLIKDMLPDVSAKVGKEADKTFGQRSRTPAVAANDAASLWSGFGVKVHVDGDQVLLDGPQWVMLDGEPVQITAMENRSNGSYNNFYVTYTNAQGRTFTVNYRKYKQAGSNRS